ncbi:MAG TPA: CooT family nickel-binding protein [bacterium]|nr:CooT family nickel-binding protein [bacterium]
MCEATAFKVLSDMSEEKIMESVTKVQIEGDRILIDDLFGDRKEIIGVIKEINLVKNRIAIISV